MFDTSSLTGVFMMTVEGQTVAEDNHDHLFDISCIIERHIYLFGMKHE